jgi:hypothetical protein
MKEKHLTMAIINTGLVLKAKFRALKQDRQIF